ncbi:ferric reductase-like transmembrane domain-containing protein [Phreatobacter sp.]|uniref:ferric reductase-like transmembrane domain-containing protein n=1 Tax=Phreatobacter sp. TaxID=1966341 RepID=UPI0025E838A9|nr:ferric reductase-like transmembrane domain-containing protein [Phreatobacter sp.]
MPSIRAVLIWAALAVAVCVPIAIAAWSPLLAWREPVYIGAGFAGIVAMALLLIQPLLAGGHLPGLPGRPGRQVHRWFGIALVLLVMAHVGGLWVTSAPDVIDALLFASPTPFSVWGVVAMWAVFAAALLALFRKSLRLSPAVWRIGHTGLAVVIVVGTVVHALLIEGAMGVVSKALFCLALAVVMTKVVMDLAIGALKRRRR